MDGTFGTPAYEEPVVAEAADGGQPEPEIDENDPRLVSESVADNIAADAYEIPPPAPDGIWRAKLKLGKVKNAAQQEVDYKSWAHPNVENGRPMFVVAVDAFLIDLTGGNGKMSYDNTRVTDSFVKSGIDSKRGTSQMTTIISKAGGKPLPGSTDRGRREQLVEVLAGEPEALVETNWEVSCQTCQKLAEAKKEKRPRAYLQGMHRFPQKLGKPDPQAQCPTCKTFNRAQVRISRYYKIGEVKPSRGIV